MADFGNRPGEIASGFLRRSTEYLVGWHNENVNDIAQCRHLIVGLGVGDDVDHPAQRCFFGGGEFPSQH